MAPPLSDLGFVPSAATPALTGAVVRDPTPPGLLLTAVPTDALYGELIRRHEEAAATLRKARDGHPLSPKTPAGACPHGQFPAWCPHCTAWGKFWNGCPPRPCVCWHAGCDKPATHVERTSTRCDPCCADHARGNGVADPLIEPPLGRPVRESL